jgi:nitroreductase
MAATLDLSPDELLSTTRAVRRRLDFDRPVPLEVVEECLRLAIQAPSGSNAQHWQFMVVTDPAKRAAIGDLYRRAFDRYRTSPGNIWEAYQGGDTARREVQQRSGDSAAYLAEHMGDAPVLLIPCHPGRFDDRPALATIATCGSVLPAFWSFMLAARARGLGTAWTTLHLMYEQEAADVLGIPFDSVTQFGLTPVAYTKGTDFQPAHRAPLDTVLHVDSW